MHLLSLALLVVSWCNKGHSQSTNSTLSVSQDGSCGIGSNQTCLDSSFGSCCSEKGFCGSTNDFCNPTAGCQSSYGSCSTNTSYISYDGRCGFTDPNKQVCIGSTYGSCCSEKGWCGGTADYCGVGCQSDFGTCGGANTTTETGGSGAASSTASATGSSAATASSSTASTSTSSSQAAASASDSATTQHSVLPYQVAIGILAGLLALLATAMAILLMRRRRRPESGPERVQIAPEKAEPDRSSCSCGGHSVYEPQPPYQDNKTTMSAEVFQQPKQQLVELGSTGHGRAELYETSVEAQGQRSS